MKHAPWIAVALALLLAAPVRAQNDPRARGIDPVSFKISPSVGSYLTAAGVRMPNGGTYRLDLLVDYTKGLLAFQLGDEKLGDLIDDRVDLHLMLAYALTSWLELALDAPFTVYQQHGFDDLRARTGFTDAPPDGSGFGDLRALARIGILSEEKSPVGLAALVEGRGLTGDDRSFLGERGYLVSPRLATGMAVTARMRASLEVGYRYRTEAGQYLNLYSGDEYTAALAGSHALPKMGSVLADAYLEILMATPARAPLTFESADALKTTLEALFGARFGFSDSVFLLAGVGRGLGIPAGYGREELRAFASLGIRGYFPASRNPDRDREGDGVLDLEDRCPDDPGPARYEGCPDRDGDGVPDLDDRCPDEPGDAKLEGCPRKDPLVVYEDGEIVLMGSINFDTGKDTLKDESFPILDRVAEVLNDHAELKKVEVGGHTDSVGSNAMNQVLSERRARSVVRYLLRKNVARKRLTSRGYGESKPVESNRTALGRAKNRRVEFTVLESDDD